MIFYAGAGGGVGLYFNESSSRRETGIAGPWAAKNIDDLLLGLEESLPRRRYSKISPIIAIRTIYHLLKQRSSCNRHIIF